MSRSRGRPPGGRLVWAWQFLIVAAWAAKGVRASDFSAPAPLTDDDGDSEADSAALVNIAIIIGLSFSLMALLWLLLKYVDKEDAAVQDEISELRGRRLQNTDLFRANNGYSWDYVMVFEVRAEDKELTPYQRKFSMKQVLHRLAAGGMETRMFYSVQRDEVYCKIRCPLGRVEKEAERIAYTLLLDSQALSTMCQHGRPGKWASIQIQDEHNQSPYEPYVHIYAPFFHRPELETLYHKYGDKAGKQTPFRGVDRLKIMYGIMVAKKVDGGCNLDIVRLLKSGCILAFYPLHDMEELRELQNKWLQYFQWPWNQPVNDVKDYYGEKIGLYFLWLGHYTTWLMGPSLLGVLAYANIIADNNNPNAYGAAIFAVFIGFWTTLFTEFWKRKQATYAMKWGMTGFEEQEQTRPQYKGFRSTSAINGRPVDYFPPGEATKRFIISQMCILGLIIVVLGAVVSIFVLKFFLNRDYKSDLTIAGVELANLIPALINAIQIQVMNVIYGAIAILLTNMENHRTDTEYEDNLIAKTFMFQFVNSYVSLIYIAFIKEVTGFDRCIGSCMSELSTNLGTIFLARLAIGNLNEVLVPLVKRNNRQKQESQGVDPGATFSMAEKEFIKETYDVMLGPFSDYAEMIVQFGYATLFVAAYPLSCVMAFVNNYIEIRVDAWKLLKVCRRPEPRSAEDIGTWYIILEIMSSLSVLSNSALIAFTSEIFDNYTWAQRVWVFVMLEHGMILFKYALSLLIPDVPDEVEIQIKRQEFLVSKVIYNTPDEDDEELVRTDTIISDQTILNKDDDF